MKKTVVATLVAALLCASGCVHPPPRTAQMESELLWLDTHGYSDDGVDLPKSKLLAVVLDIFPIPGIGHFYVGDIGDGIKSMLLFWAIVPWIKAPIDAYREAKYRNDLAYLDYAHAQGWFEQKKAEDRAKEDADRDRDRERDRDRDRDSYRDSRDRDSYRDADRAAPPSHDPPPTASSVDSDREEYERAKRAREEAASGKPVAPTRAAPAAKKKATAFCAICGEKFTAAEDGSCAACGSKP